MLATIQSRTFCLLVCRLKTKKLEYIYKTIIFPVVLYGCETWSLTLSEEHRLGVREHGAEENIWTEKGVSDWRLEKTA
jgi:hypothetical protein